MVTRGKGKRLVCYRRHPVTLPPCHCVQFSCADLLCQQYRCIIRWHGQFMTEQMAAIFVLGEGGAPLPPVGKEAHELAVGRFMQWV